MQYMLVDATAIDRIVQERRLQVADYQAGRRLVSLLRGENVDRLLPGLRIVRTDDRNVLLLGSQPDRKHCLVFDLNNAAPLLDRSDSEIVLIFQRTLRFIFKSWKGMGLSPCERVVSGRKGGKKYVLWPFPFAAATQWRLALERVTYPNDEGDHFLAFRWARDEGAGPDELPSRTRLHLALAALEDVSDSADNLRLSLSDDVHRPLEVVALDRIQDGRSVLPYEGWMNRLTAPQNDFVTRPLNSPQRLEGAAGTGKTLTLMLKAVDILRQAAATGRDAKVVFFTHSEATRQSIEDRLLIIDHAMDFQHRSREESAQSLEVTTLHQWCAERLGSTIAEVEFLDRDAAESKELQLLYVLESLEEAMERDFSTHEQFLSSQFADFLRQEDAWQVSEMLCHEIGVMIKGRAGEDLDGYVSLPSLTHNLPLSAKADRGFVFLIYRKYKDRLRTAGQYDTDDIVLTAMAQLDTPIWRRRRERDGYDAIMVDETHLFNINELSLIHFLDRGQGLPPIAFAVDRSQAVGDRGFDTGSMEDVLAHSEGTQDSTLGTVFRSSRDIVDLALSVTAGGASLFDNFADPLQSAASAFTQVDERYTRVPCIVECANDDDMLSRAEREADAMASRLPGGRAAVAVAVFDPTLMHRLSTGVRERNRPFEIITKRGDTSLVSRARDTHRFVLSSPELIGGLEFDGVVLVAVDEGRVPRDTARGRREARHFARYAAHNLLYVAITRARFEVSILINRERGVSEILKPALEQGFLEQETR